MVKIPACFTTPEFKGFITIALLLFFSLHRKHQLCLFFFQSHHLLLRRNSPNNCKLSQTEQLEHGTREQVPSPKLVLKNPASIQSCILSPPHLFSLAERPFIGLHYCLFLLSHWDTIKHLASCVSVVWAFPTCIGQSHPPRLDHRDSAAFKCQGLLMLLWVQLWMASPPQESRWPRELKFAILRQFQQGSMLLKSRTGKAVAVHP